MSLTLWMRVSAFVSGVLLVCPSTASYPNGQEATKPPISTTPLTAEQLSVYQAVLGGWFQNEEPIVNLAERTAMADSLDLSASEAQCMKGISFEKSARDVHIFGHADLMQWGLKSIRLVDTDTYAKQVHQHDPGSAIRNGKSVDSAVRDGFDHGLFTLGEIRFDKSRSYAVVSFSFWCGSLCGSGSSMLLHKRNGKWISEKSCGGWVS